MKPRFIRVTDQGDIERILNELDAPAAVGGNTLDGLIVDADQWRAYKSFQSQSEGGK